MDTMPIQFLPLPGLSDRATSSRYAAAPGSNRAIAQSRQRDRASLWDERP